MFVDLLAKYAQQEDERKFPHDVIYHAKRALQYGCSALLPGTRVAAARNLVRNYAAESESGMSSLPGIGTTAFPGTAAWINGNAAYSVEFDDIYRDSSRMLVHRSSSCVG